MSLSRARQRGQARADRANMVLIPAHRARQLAQFLEPLASPAAMVGVLSAAIAIWAIHGSVPAWTGWKEMGWNEIPLFLLIALSGAVAHELAHLAAFYRTGGREASVRARITHFFMPALTARMLLPGAAPNHKQLALISLAGPIVSAELALILNAGSTAGSGAYWGSIAVLALSISSLIPLPGSDGWHALRSARALASQGQPPT